jgi:hypothetical protein
MMLQPSPSEDIVKKPIRGFFTAGNFSSSLLLKRAEALTGGPVLTSLRLRFFD